MQTWFMKKIKLEVLVGGGVKDGRSSRCKKMSAELTFKALLRASLFTLFFIPSLPSDATAQSEWVSACSGRGHLREYLSGTSVRHAEEVEAVFIHQAGDARVLNEASVLGLEPLRRSYMVEQRQSCGWWGTKAWVI